MIFRCLKRLLAITLSFVHLFNLAGYSLLFEYLGDRSSRDINSKIESQQYDETDLVEIKVRLNLPYLPSASEYESLAGEININGNHHNYVKRKVSQDTLYLLCLPNTAKDRIENAADNYGSVANDFDGDHKNESQVKKAANFNQFQETHESYAIQAPGVIPDTPETFISILLPDSFVEMHGKPPRLDS